MSLGKGRFGLVTLLMLVGLRAQADTRYIEFVNSNWSQTLSGNWSDSNNQSGQFEYEVSFEQVDDATVLTRTYHWDGKTESFTSIIDRPNNQSTLASIYEKTFNMDNGYGRCDRGFVIEMVESMSCSWGYSQDNTMLNENLSLHVRRVSLTSSIKDQDSGTVTSFASFNGPFPY